MVGVGRDGGWAGEGDGVGAEFFLRVRFFFLRVFTSECVGLSDRVGESIGRTLKVCRWGMVQFNIYESIRREVGEDRVF